MSSELSTTLREAIGTPRPVRPVETTSAGVTRAVLGFVFASVAVASLFALRPDRLLLGPGLLWGLSTLELVLALALVVVVVRDATPGHRLPSILLPALAAAGLASHLTIAGLTRLRSAFEVAEGAELATGSLCAALVLAIGLLVGAGPLLLFRISLSPRPLTTALGLGVAAALSADALWRAICPYNDVVHLGAGHGAGMAVAATVLGLAGWRWLGGSPRDRALPSTE